MRNVAVHVFMAVVMIVSFRDKIVKAVAKIWNAHALIYPVIVVLAAMIAVLPVRLSTK